MNLLQYELFASVAQTLNISKTAQDFFISQPAVSHHLKMLEEAQGVELIKRSRHGVYLTEAGQVFLPYVHQILAIKDKAEARMSAYVKGNVGSVRIAALSSASHIISEYLKEFYVKFPEVQVDISLVDGVEMGELLQQHNHDFYFTVSNMAFDKSFYNMTIVEKVPLAIFANRNLVKDMRKIDWEFFAKQPFISVPKTDESLYGRAMALCNRHGFDPHIINTYNRAESVILSVDAGLGVGILPDSFERIYQRSNVVALRIEDDDAYSEYVAVWENRELTGAPRNFYNMCIAPSRK